MKVLVLGGDGFCGWPTSLHLSDKGHDVIVVDNLSRREIDIELEVESLTPIRPMGERIRTWKELRARTSASSTSTSPRSTNASSSCCATKAPDAIVHFGEQRAAPYSMRNPTTKRYTVDNNVRGTHNVLVAIVESGLDIALVHLGTMGVYGYGWSGSAPIPEGYLTVKVPTPDGEIEREILHPANPGSVYHMTKTLDQLLFAFYAKNDQLRITDLHQGIVWGTQTPQTATRRATDQPLRLRRRLRHRPEPLLDAGGHRSPADRARHGRSDPRLHPHPRHGALHPDRVGEPAGARRSGQRLQPGHRDLPRRVTSPN